MSILRERRKLARIVWGLAVLGLLCPFRYEAVKAALVVGVIGLWGLAVTQKRWPWGRVAAVAIGLTALAFVLLPGRPADTGQVRQTYVAALPTYRNTLYVWGGGNHMGIDCSGLVQTALIDADLGVGLRTGNPALVRQGLSLWAHTRSARAMGEGYRDETRLVAMVDSLNTANPSLLRPGDLAVPEDGTHVLAYLGGGTWIEADPRPGRVIEKTVPVADDIYFNTPMRLMRWRQLEMPERAGR